MRRSLQSTALINAFLDNLLPEQREVAEALQQAILAAAPQLRQEVKWGNLCFNDGEQNLLAIVFFKAHAHLQVFNGVMLGGEFPQLDGTGRGMRHLKFRYRQPVDQELVKAVTQASLMAPTGRFDGPRR